LRALLAHLSGFWHLPGDTGPLCVALARHRQRSERIQLQKMSRPGIRALPALQDQPYLGTATSPLSEMRVRRAASSGSR
jgi:hypothetical protein